MLVWQAVVYGVVQGLAEFLPISSSAHLTLLPWMFGWEDPGLAFDVALHWGTLAAVIGKLLDRWAESNLRGPLLIACTMAVLGLILWYADRVGRKSRDLAQMTIPRAFSIGVAQAAALVPGVSRSGATISLGLFEDFTREEIARFSFLMSTPIIFGAGLLKLPKMVHDMRAGEGDLTGAALATGFVASAVVGAAVIRWMLDYLRRRTYAAFAWYRPAVAALVVVQRLRGKK